MTYHNSSHLCDDLVPTTTSPPSTSSPDHPDYLLAPPLVLRDAGIHDHATSTTATTPCRFRPEPINTTRQCRAGHESGSPAGTHRYTRGNTRGSHDPRIRVTRGHGSSRIWVWILWWRVPAMSTHHLRTVRLTCCK